MSHTRRDWIRHLSVAASLPATWATLSRGLSAAAANADGPAATNEPYWQMVKNQFPLESGLIYMNAANVCPASRPVMDRHLEFLRDFHANPSFQNRAKYEAMREKLRDKVAGLLRVSADEVAITRNTSEGTNTIVKGLDLKAGDEIIITDHNHPSNNDSWKVRAKRDGLVVKTAMVPVPAKSSQELIDSIEKLVTAKTRVITITHLTSTTGVLYPAREIAQLAKSRGIYMHLDGAQSFGCVDVDLSAIPCDSYSTSAHKWPMGPLEAGVLFVRAPRIGQIWPSIVTAGWAENLKGARKFEVFGQRDDPRVAALEPTMDFLRMISMPAVEGRIKHLTGRLKQQLVALGNIEMKTSMDDKLSAGVVKFKLKNMPTKRAYDTLWEKNRLAIAMTASGDSEGLRLSPHVYNSVQEIDEAVAAVKGLAG